jgi:hypothetical protein
MGAHERLGVAGARASSTRRRPPCATSAKNNTGPEQAARGGQGHRGLSAQLTLVHALLVLVVHGVVS